MNFRQENDRHIHWFMFIYRDISYLFNLPTVADLVDFSVVKRSPNIFSRNCRIAGSKFRPWNFFRLKHLPNLSNSCTPIRRIRSEFASVRRFEKSSWYGFSLVATYLPNFLRNFRGERKCWLCFMRLSVSHVSVASCDFGWFQNRKSSLEKSRSEKIKIVVIFMCYSVLEVN